MGYNHENFIRIREMYETKAELAHKAADERTLVAENAVPGLIAVNRELYATGLSVIDAVMNHRGELDARMAEIERRNAELNAKKRELLVKSGYPADFTDVHYECELCNDTGYTDGKMCRCMRQELIMAGYESSGIANLLRTQTFENFSLDYFKSNATAFASMSFILETVRNYANSFRGNVREISPSWRNRSRKKPLSSAIAKTVIDSI